MSMTSRVLRNAAFQMISQVVTTALALLFNVAVPHFLGAEGFGQIFFALSFALIASVFMNLGINTFLQKEVARDAAEGEKLLAQAMSVKLALALLIYPLTMLVGRWMGVTGDALTALDVISLAFVIGSFGQTFSNYLLGEQLGWAPAAGLILDKIVLTVGSIALLWAGYGIESVAWVYLAGQVISTAYTGLVLYRKVPFALGFDRAAFARIVKGSAPFMVWVVFGEIYIRIDVVMLAKMAGDDVVGWYGTASRLYGTLLFIPNIFMSAVFPAITRKFATDEAEAGQATRRSFNLMLLVAVPIGLGTMLIAEHVITLLYDDAEFWHSIGNLQVLGLSMILVCANVVIGSALIANDRQSAWARTAVIAAFVNPALNALLIPYFHDNMGNGGFGAALATLVTECFMLVAFVRLLPAGIFDRGCSVTTLRALCAGVAMLLAAQPVMHLGLIPILLVSGVAYGAAVLAFRVIPRHDLDHIVHAVRAAAKRGA